MARIGIMGGTFNPIHNGHLKLAKQAYEECQLDTILFMPNKKPAYKTIEGNITDEQRIHMIHCAIDSIPHFQFSSIELERTDTEYTYTADTLQQLQNSNPENDYFFIMGEDSLFHFEEWYKPDTICRLCTLIVASRVDDSFDKTASIKQKCEELNMQLHARIHLLQMPVIPISSHEIRDAIQNGQMLLNTLPEEVEKYIKKEQLYQVN